MTSNKIINISSRNIPVKENTADAPNYKCSNNNTPSSGSKVEPSGFSRIRTNSCSTRKKEQSTILSVFPRVFRRENTDFLPSVRHSSIFIDQSTPYLADANQYNKRRGSDAFQVGPKLPKTGIRCSEESPGSDTVKVTDKSKEWKPTRPRRERTDGDIITRKSRQNIKENLEFKCLDAETRILEEATKMRNRNSKVLVPQQNINTSTESEETITQVSILFRRLIDRGYILRYFS